MKQHLGPIVSALLLGLASAGSAQTGAGDNYYDEPSPIRPARHAQRDGADAILLPIPTDAAVAESADAVPPPALPAPVEATIPAAPACSDGMCEPYYRDRATGCKKKRLETMLNNRAGEPNWYRYYRCEHFGYYPTNWSAWPDGWLACRTEPKPGPHPYDLRHPAPKGLPKARTTTPGDRTPSPPPARGAIEPKAAATREARSSTAQVDTAEVLDGKGHTLTTGDQSTGCSLRF